MNICLHYRVGHKTVLKSNDQAKLNPKQTVKYNMSKAKKNTQSRNCRRRKHHWRRRVQHTRRHRTNPCNSLKQENPWAPPCTAKIRNVAIMRGQSVKSTLTRGNHAPVTAELPGRRRQRLSQRTTMRTGRGRVSTGGTVKQRRSGLKE
jgi:hypothetical protein